QGRRRGARPRGDAARERGGGADARAHVDALPAVGEPALSPPRLRPQADERLRLVAQVASRPVFRTPLVRHGSLEVVCGPMFSGKSEALIRRVRRAEIAGLRSLIVKPAIDDRYDVGHGVAHGGAKVRAVTAASSAEVRRPASGYEAVGVDEVQFFDDGIVDAIGDLVERGARVVAAGLAQDFRRLPFG